MPARAGHNQKDAMPSPPLPAPAEALHDFWGGGAKGELRIGWCAPCQGLRHPSVEVCPTCLAPIAGSRVVSGKAVVLACSVNHQPWVEGLTPPYVIAIVGLAEDPAVRLTTNILTDAPADVHVGMAVRVVFRNHGEVWLPLFEPEPGAAPVPVALPVPASAVPLRHGTTKFEDKVALTGIGMSRLGRRLPDSELALALEACRAAIDDAGLDRTDVDGLCAYPGTPGLPGFSHGGVRMVEQTLRLTPNWHCGAHETPGQIGTVIDAMLAVASGLCRHVLCFTGFSESRRPSFRGTGNIEPVHHEAAWSLPFGCASPVNWLALYASHYCAKYGVDPDFLGHIAVNNRRHAGLNPNALFREPLSLDDYRNARPISTPFRLFDCDVPCDGAMAVVVSAVETARDLRHPPVLVEAAGTRIGEPQSWDQGTLTHQPQVFSAARHLWSRTTLKPADVDVALLYDGFTFNVVSWLEALDFCAPGEAAGFIGDGSRIALDGALPLNPHGGQLSEGRSNGYGLLLEAVRQLRGGTGARQVAGARTAVVTTGGAIPAGCLLLRAA